MAKEGETVVFFIETKEFFQYKVGKIRERYFKRHNDKIVDIYSVFVHEEKKLYKDIADKQIHNIPSFVLFLRFAQNYKADELPLFKEKLKMYSKDIFDINKSDVNGNTILHLVEILQYPELVKIALDLGADEDVNSKNISPLYIAIKNDYYETSKLLSPVDLEEEIRVTRSLDEWLEFLRIDFSRAELFEDANWCSDYADKILDRIDKLDDEGDILKCLDVFDYGSHQLYEGVKSLCNSLGVSTNQAVDLRQSYSSDLIQIGLSAYQTQKYAVAERIFCMLSSKNCDNSIGKVNYSYMLRRGECKNFNDNYKLEALRLLYPIAKTGDVFATVNLSLTFALCFGKETDWQLADKLMANLTQYNIDSIVQWWKDVAVQGDIEGDLVHYFLLRHNKIDESDLGSLKSLSRRIRKNIPGIPDWICEDSDFDSLDDVFDAFDDVDFFELLDEYLNNMPRNRGSADEILEKIEIFDILDLYQTVLDYDFRIFLTNEELHKLVKDYKEKFSVGLPFDTDEI